MRAAVDVPLLRKDFVVEPYSWPRRVDAGADAVLLIAGGARAGDACATLWAAAGELRLDVLVEVVHPFELERAARARGARWSGVNAATSRRSRWTWPGSSGSLRGSRGRAAVLVAESGIRTAGGRAPAGPRRAPARRWSGEALMRARGPRRGGRDALSGGGRAHPGEDLRRSPALEDALALPSRPGCDAVGFNFWPGSKRYVPRRPRRRDRRRALPAGVLRVGVFVRAGPRRGRARRWRDSASARSSSTGTRTRRTTPGLRRAGRGRCCASSSALPESVSAHAAGAAARRARAEASAARGRRFDWSLAHGARRFGVPVWLAGGLSPDNVGEAVRRAAPVGVDVASGRGVGPGVKDPALVRAFVAAVRAAEER